MYRLDAQLLGDGVAAMSDDYDVMFVLDAGQFRQPSELTSIDSRSSFSPSAAEAADVVGPQPGLRGEQVRQDRSTDQQLAADLELLDVNAVGQPVLAALLVEDDDVVSDRGCR